MVVGCVARELVLRCCSMRHVPAIGERHPFRPADLPQELVDEIDFHFSGLTRGRELLEHLFWFDPVSC